MNKQGINIVWLKRDLRLRDHLPLSYVETSDLPTLILYIYEPSIISDDHYDMRHWRFVWESLKYMNEQLDRFGLSIKIIQGEAINVFKLISNNFDIVSLLSYQETGLEITFKRDRIVKEFCKENNIIWKEFFQDGVRRKLNNRKKWTSIWEEEMNARIKDIDFNKINNTIDFSFLTDIFSLKDDFLNQLKSRNSNFQPGGSNYAYKYLKSFYEKRGIEYMKNISKPYLSRKSCSRISPYLAWGNLSIREAYQYAVNKGYHRIGKRNHQQFISRLWWRSHFMQKFETDCSMEFFEVNRGFLQLNRNKKHEFLDLWEKGMTGFPMIDASVRCLKKTGYINFRMRAMLVSFATFSLWLDWREVSLCLSSWFLDFEPGIHYGQIHMQSGNNGYNTLRIYNPGKQVEKNDSEAIFIKKWCPELKDIPSHMIAEPWKLTIMEQQFYNCIIGKDYPKNIIDFKTETKKNKDQYWAIRQSADVQDRLPKLLKRLVVPDSIKARDAGLVTGDHNKNIE